MELSYKYVTVRAYKQPKKGQYRDENCIVDTVDSVFIVAKTEEENIAYFEKEYFERHKKHRHHDIVGSISMHYVGKEVLDDPIADAKIEAELFKGSEI